MTANKLIQGLSNICQAQPLAEKWLIVPSLRVGHQWIQQVARSGQSVLNLHLKTMNLMAFELASSVLATEGLEIASRPARILLVDQVFRECASRGLHYFRHLRCNRRLSETLLRSLETLRMAGIRPDDLHDHSFRVPAKGADLRSLAIGYEAALQAAGLVDLSGVLQIAAREFRENGQQMPAEVVLLIPEDTQLSHLEQQLLAQFPECQQIRVPVDLTTSTAMAAGDTSLPASLASYHWHQPETPMPNHGPDIKILERSAATGEVSEVREVFRRCLSGGIPWDHVEILYSDRETYTPLLLETLCAVQPGLASTVSEMPITFAEGLPCSLTRPGRALKAWCDWILSDCPQTGLVQMIKQGLLQPGDTRARTSFGRMASLLRVLGIGAGIDRYLPLINTAIESLQSHRDPDREDGVDNDAVQTSQADAVRMATWESLACVVRQIHATVPKSTTTGADVFAAGQKFLETCVRSVNDLDRYASAKLLGDISEISEWSTKHGTFPAAEAWEWLQSLSSDSRVMGSGPRPGALYVDSIHAGGHTGRPYTYILGLDDSRFPGASLQDPLLLDSERRRISDGLITAASLRDAAFGELCCLLARLRGQVVLSYSTRGLADGREQFPSPVLQDLARRATPDEQEAAADPESRGKSLASYVATKEEQVLTLGDWWLNQMVLHHGVQDCQKALFQAYPHLRRGEVARSARNSDCLNEFNGLVLIESPEADRAWSANRLEMLGTCPLRYFFNYELGIRLPTEFEYDPEQWLTPLARGSLLHEVFESFLTPFVADQRVPEFERDHSTLTVILDQQIERYRNLYPPPSTAVFERECRSLRSTVNTFLREEAAHLAQTGNRPRVLELSLGMPPVGAGTEWDREEPIQLSFHGSRPISVRGRIDRVETVGGNNDRYKIWDYKTGSAFGFDEAKPFSSGRKIQAYLYTTMLGHRLRELFGSEAEVEGFGYFFPGEKEKGKRIQWNTHELSDGATIVADLLTIADNGLFTATDDRSDCKYCEYRTICRQPKQVTETTSRLMQGADAERLAPFHRIRGSSKPQEG